jgi:hypothetical protein
MLYSCDNGSGGNNNDCSEICGGCSDGDNEREDDGNGLVTVAMVAGQRQLQQWRWQWWRTICCVQSPPNSVKDIKRS